MQDDLAPAGPDTERGELELTTLLVTDLENSTRLVDTLGDSAAAALFARHDRLARDLMRAHGGREIDKTDGFLVLFERPLQSVFFALAYTRALADLGVAQGAPLAARIGIHYGEVVLRRNPAEDVRQGAKPIEVEGLAKPATARLMGLAMGGQVLLTRAAFDLARRGLVGASSPVGVIQWLAHGAYRVKGVGEALEVYEAGVEGLSPLTPPPDTDKAARVRDDDTIRGWRPAPGLGVPRRKHWTLDEKLGEGGFGEVWLAHHAKTRELRVFKFCFAAERLGGLRREVTLFRLLKEALGDRPDIVRLLDWDFEQAPYLVELEHAVGGSLDDWAQARGGLAGLPLALRLEIAAQVADALAAAHSTGVLHKDLKPANVLLTDTASGPRAQLTDFGIGMLTDPAKLAEYGITVSGMTQTANELAEGGASGTPGYMAPELFTGKPPTVGWCPCPHWAGLLG